MSQKRNTTTVFVTGATGFIGAAVARHLLDSGYHVKVLRRPGSNTENIDGLTVEQVPGDLANVGRLTDAMANCAAVYHVAADYRLWSRDPEELYVTNVQGTANIMTAALRAEVQRVVYTSSVCTLATSSDGSVGNEQRPVSLDDMVGHYKRSKYLAEEMVKDMVSTRGLPAVIVNPSTPVGPGDVKPTPTGRIIQDALAGKIPAFVNTGLNLVHVDDVARGHLLAHQYGRIGERYILGGQDMTLQAILREIATITGARPPTLKIPYSLAYAVAAIAESAAHINGTSDPLATRDGVRMSRKLMYFSSEKARRLLGYTARPARAALHDAVAWFRERQRV
ncbi:MAG: NAD-dependent epimerase/dehydratase family protein [Gammaproteobacteria bacterium]|nr:NAD-dependent epimerase/dehydratase family protein [Gammaproteobacteria bacterium]